MKTYLRGIWLGCLCGTASAIAAAGSQGAEAPVARPAGPAWHPSVIRVEHQGEPRTVVAVRGERAQIEVDGRRVTLKPSAEFRLERARAYGPGSVEVINDSVELRRLETQTMYEARYGGAPGDGQNDLRVLHCVELRSNRDLADCYLAMLYFDPQFAVDSSQEPAVWFLFEQIGWLKAGEIRKVTIKPGKQPYGLRIPLLFAHGQEIRTNRSVDLALFCQRLDRLRHQKSLAEYVAAHAGRTVAPQPVLKLQPHFPDRVAALTIPARVDAVFSVLDDGTVADVQLKTELDADVHAEITRALRGWLFLPLLKDGQPQRSTGSLSVRIEAAVPLTSGIARPGS